MPSAIHSTKAPLASADHPVKANFGQFLGVTAIKTRTIDDIKKAETVKGPTPMYRKKEGAQLVKVTPQAQANFFQYQRANGVRRVGTIGDTEKAECMRAVLARLGKITNKIRMEPGAQLVDVTLTCPEKTTHHQYWEVVSEKRNYKPNGSRYVSPPAAIKYSAPPPPISARYVPEPVATVQYSVPPPPLAPVFNSVNTNQQKPPTRTRCPLAIVPPPETQSIFPTPPTSGPTSPTPVPPSDTEEPPQFVFNMGVVNAPRAGCHVKISDSDEGFIVTEDKDFQPKKTKIFTSEELQKQSILVDEWKQKIQETL